jgi:hypothetical protein
MESKYLLIETIDATNNQHMNNDNTRRVETGEEHLDGLENEEEETVNWRWFASETELPSLHFGRKGRHSAVLLF